jgi:hypothetical protein
MPHLIARANEAVLEAQCLRREGRALRREAAMRASELGETIQRAHPSRKSSPRALVDQATPGSDKPR